MIVDPRRIREERRRRAWTQAQLAGAAGLGLRTVQRIERTGRASFESVQAIAAALSVGVTELRSEMPVRPAAASGGPVIRLLLAALSGAAVAWYIDRRLGAGFLLAPGIPSEVGFYAVPGLVFAAAVLFPHLERRRGLARRALALTAASGLSFFCAVDVFDGLHGWLDRPLNATPAYLLASLAGAGIVMLAARWLIPLRVSRGFWLVGAAAALAGGVCMLAAGVAGDAGLGVAMLCFAVWHVLMSLTVELGRADSAGRARAAAALRAIRQVLPGGELWRTAARRPASSSAGRGHGPLYSMDFRPDRMKGNPTMQHRKLISTFAAGFGLALLLTGRIPFGGDSAHAQSNGFTALDYQQITQLINRYAYGIDTCANDGYDYADVFTEDGVFIDKNSDAGFAAGGRVLARGREALAELVGGGSRKCATKLVWTDWSHLMLNHEITPTADGATGRVYLVQLGMDGPGSVARHGGYEDVYVRTADGWRIQSRTHVRNKAWHHPLLQTPDLN